MPLTEIHTEAFRNLRDGRLTLSPQINLIYGSNGSGKTSLLEAIHYLGLGRSFRTHKHEMVVNHGRDQLTVSGKVEQDGRNSHSGSHRIGMSRNVRDRSTVLKVDGERVKSLSSLAQHLPVSVIDPGAFDIVTGSPANRRQFLDWGVFHVEHSFAALWQQLQKALIQRNKILRNGRMEPALMRVWNARYVELAEAVTARRQTCFEALEPIIQELLQQAGCDWGAQLTLSFSRGWDRQRSLSDLVESQIEQELKVGHTLYGPNRADIRLRIAQKPAAEVLSRGQQKTLVVLLKLAQGRLLEHQTHRKCAFLLDDINAELDESNQRLLAHHLLELGSQVFVTSIEKPDPSRLWGTSHPDLKMFHVEHGELSEQ
ncbi:DNA replication/repair protein RecF [Marinobacteraceae bacterium S3BR75-40.1]